MKKKRNKGTSPLAVVTLDLPAGLAFKIEDASRKQAGRPSPTKYFGERVTAGLAQFENDVDLSLAKQAALLAIYKRNFYDMQYILNSKYGGKMTGIDAMFQLRVREAFRSLDELHNSLAALCLQPPEALTEMHREATLAVNVCLGSGMVNATVTREARSLARLLVALNAVGDPNFS
jgi:hypothetical protein